MTRTWQKIYFGIILLAAMCTVTGNGFARWQEDPAVVSFVSALRQALDLTNAQEKQVTSVAREYFRKVQELKTEDVAGTELQLKIKSLRKDMDSDLEHYLTEDQVTMYESQGGQFQESPTSVKAPTRAGDIMHTSAAEARSQNNSGEFWTGNGVLQSGGLNNKSSGIW